MEIQPDAVLVSLPDGNWALLVRGRAKLNGLAPLPLQVLNDGDEIRSLDKLDQVHRVSTAARSEPLAFVPGKEEMSCGRCRARLAVDETVISCPSCRALYHAPCFDYGPCLTCRQSFDEAGGTGEPMEEDE
jgi:hypothetical protein